MKKKKAESFLCTRQHQTYHILEYYWYYYINKIVTKSTITEVRYCHFLGFPEGVSVRYEEIHSSLKSKLFLHSDLQFLLWNCRTVSLIKSYTEAQILYLAPHCACICKATKTILIPCTCLPAQTKAVQAFFPQTACRLRSSSVFLTKKNYGNLIKHEENPTT